MEVKSNPLRRKMELAVWGIWGFGGRKGRLPDKPDEPFCCGVLFCFQLVEDEFLEGFGLIGGCELSVSYFLGCISSHRS
jgi:hypothetical protein